MGNTRARYRRILRFAARYIIQTWWYELVLPRVGFAKVVARGREVRLTRIAQRFHALAVDLGGLMIKVGQYLSSRLDILPPEITKELAGLQDEVPPVPFDAIRRLAEAELGVPLQRAYGGFEPTPLAAASLGQAHRARLAPIDAADMGYDEAVVKVQRPGIETIVAVDLKALRRVAGWLSRVRFVANHVDLPSLFEEFAATSLQEIDYLQEAANAERFGASSSCSWCSGHSVDVVGDEVGVDRSGHEGAETERDGDVGEHVHDIADRPHPRHRGAPVVVDVDPVAELACGRARAERSAHRITRAHRPGAWSGR